jgi:hypothetical protein
MSNETISTQIPFNVPAAPTLEQQAQTAPDAAAENPGNLSVVFHGEEQVGTRDYAQVNFGTETNGRGGILGTARTPHGAPAGRLSPDSVVTVNGVEMRLKHAEAAGLIRYVGGEYVEANAQQQAAITNEPTPQQQQEKAEEAAKVGFAAEVEAFLGETVGRIAPSIQTNIIESALSVAFSPDVDFAVDKQNLAGVAADFGIDPSRLQDAMRYAEIGFRTQASDALKKAGIAREDSESFLEWAMANRKAEFLAAVRQHVYARDPSGYAAVAKQYLRNSAPAQQTLEQHGVKTRVLPNGQRLVTVPGRPEVPVEVAARLDWI